MVQLLRLILAGSRGGGIADEGDKVLIFTQWDAHVRFLSGVLHQAGLPHLSLLGTDALPARVTTIQRFSSSVHGFPSSDADQVLLMSSQYFASGINLQAARHVILVHPYCTANARSAAEVQIADLVSYEQQAIGRVRRFPQTKPVTIYRLFAPGTAEDEMYSGRWET